MKKIVYIICLLLIVSIGGCAAWGTYYYQPGKTLEQCLQDSRECNRHPAGNLTFYPLCMRESGYQELSKEQLSEGIRTRQVGFSFYYIAGQ